MTSCPNGSGGLDRFEARAAVEEALAEEGLLLESRAYTIPLGLSQRTGEPVEPILSTQWWFKMSEVAPAVLEGLEAGEMQLTPERYTKVNRDWLDGPARLEHLASALVGSPNPRLVRRRGQCLCARPRKPLPSTRPTTRGMEGLELTQDQ